ncbi:alpha/beta hydrolase [Bradyrhizobium sp. SK17]|uniref:alpha/beta hydrolase family protein n=1 Tax=Bradyrhizobium sp. SK17 TaxID=2057741 RepID=UPI000C314779|nr:alpha/beta fold hydrolase [Bradyrhizobium sp. SK17]AUC95537.1 alpha/beta hydrolase [Bradyrhizobium sp. SK17]
MFEYFEGNYPWNLATLMTLNNGGLITEVDDVLRPLKAIAANADNAANEKFCLAWRTAAQKVEKTAQLDEQNGNFRAAAGKYARAANYYFAAERQTSIHDPDRERLYRAFLAAFGKFVTLGRENCERVEIPYENGTTLPALYVRGKGDAAKKPCMVHFDGLDVNKEFIYIGGMAEELAERGISTLIVDHPGVGEALRFRGMKSIVETERPASACVDWLIKRDDIDPARIGMMALSLGGYYAPRAAAFEPRFACCVAWGAMYDVGIGVRKRLAGGGGQKSVHHFFEHIQWVMGLDSMEEVQVRADKMTLNGILDRIRCPFLIVHGENDRQVPVEFARRTYEEAVNSADRQLRIHTVEEGGSEHCSVDNRELTVSYMAHWIGRTLKAPKELA